MSFHLQGRSTLFCNAAQSVHRPAASPAPPEALEALEPRRLLSSTTLLSSGTLNILGSSKNDIISVYLVAGNPGLLQVKNRGDISTFELPEVQQIRVEGFSGHDFILISNSNGAIKIPTRIYGGAGNDTITGGQTRDRIYGGTGNDSILGSGGHDIIYGEEGNDTIRGENGHDYLVGGDDNDFIEGNAGNDKLFGSDGNDTLHGNEGNDLMYGGAGGDTLQGFAGDDSICGGDGGDFILGGDGRDYLYGGAGNDFILGGAGDDDISGGAGDDTINGQEGNDDYYDDDERAANEFADDLGPNLLPDFAFVCDDKL